MKFKHDKEKTKFYTELGEGKEAFAEYKMKDNVIDFHHTKVPKEYEGQGIARKLYDFASQYVRENNLTPEPSCSYAQKYFEKHYKKSEQ